MTQSFIDALMHFFALLYLPLPGRKNSHIKSRLEDYIEKAGILVPAQDCLKVFNKYSGKYYQDFNARITEGETEIFTIYRQMITEAARRTQMNLYLSERYLIILALTEFSGLFSNRNKSILADIREIAINLNILPEDFEEGLHFLFDENSPPDKSELRIEESNVEVLEGSWIEMHKQDIDLEDRHLLSHVVKGKLNVKYFEKYHLFVLKYSGTQKLVVNEKLVYPQYFYSFGHNAVLIFDDTDKVYFEDIAVHFHLKFNLSRIKIEGYDLEFKYPGSGYSVKPFSFSEEAGQLIGIVGNNGVGKSTILKLIAGINQPSSGDVLVNGVSIIKNRFKLQSFIGFVSHDNMCFDELTVYENIFYHAQLCMGDLETEELQKRTLATIDKFDLSDISHLKPCEFAKRQISDFDRVSLNIALELIRDPFLLCLDEPLSGLPYADAKRLLTILKEETFEGKIVFLSVHLPTPEIYNMFDNVWFVDQGGYMIYQGGPRYARDYFNSSGIIPFHIVSAREDVVSPEEIISQVETKKIRPDGVISDERLVEPEKWYNLFRENQSPEDHPTSTEKPIPVNPSSLPGIEKQFAVYLLRLIKIRFSNLNYILLNLVAVPVAGLIIALIARHSDGSGYSFSENKYFPLFIFLFVCYALFIGLLNGAHEIIYEKERNKRDSNLNLSYFSYINSKFIFIAVVSLFQSVLFTTLCFLILETDGLFWSFLLVFYSLNLLCGIISLILSSSFNKISSIYIFLPFLVIPNLLFAGFLVSYNDLGGRQAWGIFHVISDLVPSRWSWEALMVESYTNNLYNRQFFPDNLNYYQAFFNKDILIPVLFDKLEMCLEYYHNNETENLDSCLKLLKNEINILSHADHVAPFETYQQLNTTDFDESTHNDLFGYLTYLNFYFESEMQDLITMIEYKENLAGLDSAFIRLKQRNHNKQLEALLTEGYDSPEVEFSGSRLIKRGAPVYILPGYPGGRAHFYSPFKKVGNQYLSTYSFNLTIIWVLSAFFYLLLLTNFLPFLITCIQRRFCL